MKTSKEFIIRIFILFVAPLWIFAQENKWGLPESATGKAASAILNTIEQNEDAYTKKFLNEWCTETFRTAFPMDAHLNAFKDVNEQLGHFEIAGVKKTGDFNAELLLKSGRAETAIRVLFELTPEPPHLIAGLGFRKHESEPKFTSMDEMKKYIRKITEKNRFSGAVLIAKDEKLLFKEAYGLASKRYNVPNEVTTRFNIGSINKIFTKIAVYQLIEQGRLSQEDPIGKYLSMFPEDILKKVTIRHLLEHSSGMGHYWNEKYKNRFADLRTVNDFIELFKEESLAFEPGTRKQYSNSGYTVLGAVIESVTGQDYYEYILENIYKPAGMNHSDHYEMDTPIPDLATGYTNHNPDGSEGEDFKRNNIYFAFKGGPAGGGYSTLDDLLKFDIALKSGAFFKDPDSGEAQLFSQSGGLGIAGGGPGTCAILESDWELGYTVVVLSNYDPPAAEELGLAIMEMLRK